MFTSIVGYLENSFYKWYLARNKIWDMISPLQMSKEKHIKFSQSLKTQTQCLASGKQNEKEEDVMQRIWNVMCKWLSDYHISLYKLKIHTYVHIPASFPRNKIVQSSQLYLAPLIFSRKYFLSKYQKTIIICLSKGECKHSN